MQSIYHNYMGMHVASAGSFEEWRNAVRKLLAHEVAPHDVQWIAQTDSANLFSASESADVHLTAAPGKAPGLPQPAQTSLHIPRKMMEMLQAAACFRAADRWAFLYRVVWRWRKGEEDVLSAADPDGKRLYRMAKSVHKEEHDMRAYLRFRERPDDAEPPRFIAWYEPAHDILPQVAVHFAKRMGNTSWMIATPDASVLWNGKQLHYTGPLMQGPADINDSGESLWLTYYRSIFNPARLNTTVMHSHIPSRFWKNLPEGAVVPALVAAASAGARKVGQLHEVGQRGGRVITIAPERAQPQRALTTSLQDCRRCELWCNATQAVAGVGPVDARIMLVGEQPGDQEDITGLPFIGPAGQLLDDVLEQSGLKRSEVYLTNAVKHFKWEPRGKRRIHKTPAQREIMACRAWLEDEVERTQPKVIVALGSTALKSLLNTHTVNLASLLGKPFEHEGRWIIAVYHPAYALRVPDIKSREQAVEVMVEGLRQANILRSRPDNAAELFARPKL